MIELTFDHTGGFPKGGLNGRTTWSGCLGLFLIPALDLVNLVVLTTFLLAVAGVLGSPACVGACALEKDVFNVTIREGRSEADVGEFEAGVDSTFCRFLAVFGASAVAGRLSFTDWRVETLGAIFFDLQ